MSALLRHEVGSILASFRRRPLVPLLAAGMLALGIAANVAVFTVISRTILRPLPYRDPERLVVIASSFIEPDHTEKDRPSGSVEIVQWQQRSAQFAGIEAARVLWSTVREGDRPESVAGCSVTGGIFRLLGVRPMLGRDFVREDDVPDARAAIITYGWWQRRFGGDRGVIGRTIFINGRPVSIVGVLPRDFELAVLTPPPELFIPLGFGPANMPTPNARMFTVFGRLRDGVTASQAEGELRRISAQLDREFPQSQHLWTAKVRTLRYAAFGDRQHKLVILWIAVVLVHLLACVNVASLISVQIADERGLTALRLILGAERKHILRYRLIESLVITGAGAAAGLAGGLIALRMLLLHEADTAFTTPVPQAWMMPAFLIAISVMTGLLVAIVPALRETRTTLTSALSEQGGRASSSVRGTRMRELFIITEVALAVPLLLAAAATVQHFRDLQKTSIGFEPRNVLVAQILLPPRYDKTGRTAFARDLLARVEAMPGVVSATSTTCNFAPDSAVTTMLSTDRFPEPMSSNFRRITPRYFETMKIPLIAGRAFTPGDALDSPPVMIVSASLAKKLFPGGDALGQKIRRGAPNPPATVVGIAPDVLDDGAASDQLPTIYAPFLQNNNIFFTLLVRTKGDPLSVRDAVRRAVWSIDRDITPAVEKPLTELTAAALSTDRLQMLLLGGFGFVALMLAVVGIYGMTAYAIAKRMREIGVRLAFGATPRDVIVEVVRRAAVTVAAGLAIGIGLALAAQRIGSLVVYGAARFDAATATIVMGLLFATALVAGCIPSLRTRRAQPSLLLRDA